MAKRGQLTKAVKEVSTRVLGYEIDQVELRLIPYIHHCMINEQRIDPRKINIAERGVLSKWRERGLIEGGAGGMPINRDFYDAMNEILWLGYITYADQHD